MMTRRLAAALILGGILLVLLSWLWPNLAAGRGRWTNEDARALAEAGAALHAGEGHNGAATGSAPQTDEHSAQQRYKELRNQLTDAQTRGERAALVMRYLGIALTIAGVVVHFAAGQPSGSPQR